MKMGAFLRRVRLSTIIPVKYRTLPERFKGGRVENWAIYWKGLFADYREVGRDIITDVRTRPYKAALIGGGITLMTIAYNSTPNEHTFRHQLLENANRLSLVSSSLRNPTSEAHIEFLSKCLDEGLIRTLNLGVISLLWIENYDRAVTQFAAQCQYLKPKYLTFYERIVDIGAYGKWYIVDLKMKDYDVNDNEWNAERTDVDEKLNP